MFNKSSSSLSAAALAATLMLAPISASALSTANVKYEGAWLEAGFVSPVTTTLDGETRGVSAGPFKMSSGTPVNGLSEFLAWCFELETTMVQNSARVYTIGADVLGDTRSRMQKLFDANYSDVLTALETDNANARNVGAAFQIAIWDVLYNSGESVRFTFSTSIKSVSDQVGIFLGGLSKTDVEREWIITELKADGTQDVGVIGAIPLPAAAWLLLTATGGLIIAKRRRQREDA